VRQLVAHALERRLADELADQHLLGLVGELALGVEHRPLGQPRDEQVGQQLHLEVGHGAGRHDLGPLAELRDGQQLLADLLVARLPEGPVLYPEGELTDEPEQVLIGELIREAALEGVRDELPHSIAVTVEEMHLREDRPEDRPLLDVYATLHVERDSQKAIVLGTGGARLKGVGTTARHQIEALLGMRVYLDLHVSVAKDWQRDPKQLKKLGF
jgi:GTP-binding protein Era